MEGINPILIQGDKSWSDPARVMNHLVSIINQAEYNEARWDARLKDEEGVEEHSKNE